MQLTHIDEQGKAKMIDVGVKPTTERVAVAQGMVLMLPETLQLIARGNMEKGDVLTVAQLAGIMGAKRTPELIPLCHQLNLTNVAVELEVDEERGGVEITATARCIGQTGVEMEALTAVSVAALTVYDMIKAVERGARITDIHLVHKSGGKSGTWNLA